MKRTVIFGLILVCMFSSCKSTNVSDAKSESEDFSQALSEHIALVSLEANFSTGYKWECSVEDSEIAEVIADDYVSDDADEKLVGAGGVQTFFIKCKKEGSTTLEFNYKRSWEENEGIEKRVMTLNVKEDLSGEILE